MSEEETGAGNLSRSLHVEVHSFPSQRSTSAASKDRLMLDIILHFRRTEVLVRKQFTDSLGEKSSVCSYSCFIRRTVSTPGVVAVPTEVHGSAFVSSMSLK